MSFPERWKRWTGAVRENVSRVPRRFETASLRSQLLVSHLVMAMLTVLVFGSVLYWMMSRAVYRQAEADLLAAGQLLVQDLADAGPEATPRIAETYFHRFGPAPRDRAYFAIWDAGGRRIAATERLPVEAVPEAAPPATHGPRPFVTRIYGSHLDIVMTTPDGGQLLIGRPLAKEFDGLWRLIAQLLLLGLVCLVLALIGALWLARKLSRPLEQITATAEGISSRNLAQHLDVGPASQEVMRLAVVFNTMLDGLRAAFDRQVRFTADASHELRTPISVVLAQAEHSLARDRAPDEYREALQTCLHAAQRMKRLTDDLLLLAQADAGRLQARREPVDLAAAAREAVEMLRPAADAKQIRLETRLSPAIVLGDGDRLARIVTNLVMNAIQYGGGADVTIDVHSDGSQAVLIVQDNGVGIAAEHQSRLFERFYRADAARTHHAEAGTGLGLSIVAEIVAAHGGTIDVQSAVERGTTMTVRLPRTKPKT